LVRYRGIGFCAPRAAVNSIKIAHARCRDSLAGAARRACSTSTAGVEKRFHPYPAIKPRLTPMTNRIRGVLAPVLTPFDRNLQPDVALFIAHCRWLLDCGAGLAIFGTNSEAASLSVEERLLLMDCVLDAGISPQRLMPGTGGCSISDAVSLTRHAVTNGAAGVLVVPPFFFKDVCDDGLFAYYSEVIERVGDTRLALYLYHIPQMSHAPISLPLIERLLARYPDTIAGAKDSSGDWSNSKAMIDNFASDGFDVFPASESLLSAAMAIGGAGCISATLNVNPLGIAALYEGWQGDNGGRLQAAADRVRRIFQQVPMIAGMKATVARWSDTNSWSTVRPPLVKLGEPQASALEKVLDAAGFRMLGYPTLERRDSAGIVCAETGPRSRVEQFGSGPT
jgi:4-hydroxy-tetrahydrodipicolinate synthase